MPKQAVALTTGASEASAGSVVGVGPHDKLRMQTEARVAASIAVSLLAALGTPSGQTAPGRVTLRFHHLHYRVPDPGAALGEAADAFKGTRTILQGLGVGVRVGRQYVLFEQIRNVRPFEPRPNAR